MNGISGHAEYKRTDNGDNPTIHRRFEGVWTDVPIANQSKVHYNGYLLLKYNCNIGVDAVTAACAKYIFEYMTKGADMTNDRIAGVTSEIEHYHIHDTNQLRKQPVVCSAITFVTALLPSFSYMRILGVTINSKFWQMPHVINCSLLHRTRFQIYREILTGLPTHISSTFHYTTNLKLIPIPKRGKTTLSRQRQRQVNGWMPTVTPFS